ncbi:MAG TPA: TRAP transporter small permease [Ramlibacter sp.]|nr:TRAP transporter small permease [Ramlibacter sp.]
MTGGGDGHRFARPLDGLYLACIWTAGIAIALMSVIIPMGVVMRYVFGFGAQWPEPIAILLMVVFTFIGAAAAYRAGGHIAVSMITDALPTPAQWVAARLADAFMAVICAFVLWYGAKLCDATMGQTISELPWLPVGVTYLPIPIGAAATLLFVLERIAYGAQAARAVVRLGEIE